LKAGGSRVKILKGDLLQHNFGLAPSVYKKLEDEVSVIVHSAADVNLAKDYSKLVHTNLTSTQHIIELAQSKKGKAIHYISTLAVSGYPADGGTRSFSENDFEYGQLFSSDYEKSKFEAEKMIWSYFQNAGKGKIYRVGHIAASSTNGRFQRNIGQNRILQVIKGMLLTGQVPGNYNEKLSFSYVDIVAKGIAGIFLENIYSEMRCLHMESPHYISFIRVAEMMQQLGYEIEVVNMEMFKNTVEHFVAPVAEKNEVGLMNNWIQRAIDFPRKINYVSSSSLQLMAQTGLYFPEPKLEWFSALFKEAISVGYFHSPRLQSTFSPLLNVELI
jgi:thioester reductase-like protein